jgi:hypothetical protein
MAFPVFAPGDVLNASDMNAVGLWLIKTQTIGTTVSSVTVSDVFSADYDNYRIVVSVNSASQTLNLLMTLGSTTAAYYWSVAAASFAGGLTGSGVANGSSWFVLSPGADGGATSIDVYDPFASNQTGFTVATPIYVTNGSVYSGGGYLNNTTSYTAFTLTTSAGTITGGTIRVYGYRN